MGRELRLRHVYDKIYVSAVESVLVRRTISLDQDKYETFMYVEDVVLINNCQLYCVIAIIIQMYEHCWIHRKLPSRGHSQQVGPVVSG